jgi:dipeptidyl aminopeptidase/acylaminoacyl peptidase
LPLPNNVIAGGRTAGGAISVSPDGTRVAFTMGESRGSSRDTHIWVVNLDGTGLHRLTSPPNPRSGSNFSFGSPTWSPDGKWVAGVLDMKGRLSAPVFPPGDTVAPASQIIGTTGCGSSPVVVLPANAEHVAISWPAFDARYNVKVKASSGRGAEWLTSCNSIAWLP